MQLTLSKRILGLTMIIVVILLALGVVAFWAARNLAGNADQAARHLQDAREVTSAALQVAKRTQSQAELLISRDLSQQKTFDAITADFRSYLHKIQAMPLARQHRDMLARIKQADATLVKIFHQGIIPEIRYQRQKVLAKSLAMADKFIRQVELNGRKIAASLRKRMQISALAREYKRVITEAGQLDAVNQMMFWLMKMYQAQAELIINGDQSSLFRYDKAKTQVEQFRRLVSQAMQTDEEKRWFSFLIQAHENYDLLMRERVVPAVKRRAENRLQKLHEQSHRVLNSLRHDIDRLAETLTQEANRTVQRYQETSDRVQVLILVIALVAIAAGIVLSLLLARSISRPIAETRRAIAAFADGDFTFQAQEDYLNRGDELGEMIRDLNETSRRLAETVREVIKVTGLVTSHAEEINQFNQNLNEHTQHQAAAIEETAAAVEELTASVRQNAAHARRANDVAHHTAQMTSDGKEVVAGTAAAMQAVTESSNKISDITSVVNEIAFQTNLLALNAAVEAARAGEAGRGFAVVASEVRNLAGRSAKAAKEIQAIIAESEAKVEMGNQMVAKSSKLLNEVMANVQEVAETIDEIAAASQEQAIGIEEINHAMGQMDRSVQHNAAMVEEAASASEKMSAVAEQLKRQMRQFKVATESEPWPAPQALPPAAQPDRPAANGQAPAGRQTLPRGYTQEDPFFTEMDTDDF